MSANDAIRAARKVAQKKLEASGGAKWFRDDRIEPLTGCTQCDNNGWPEGCPTCHQGCRDENPSGVLGVIDRHLVGVMDGSQDVQSLELVRGLIVRLKNGEVDDES